MPIQGKITRVVAERKFFFIDRDFFCHFNSIDFDPKEGVEVEYEPGKNKEGKPEARNVKRAAGFFDQYVTELEKGYFVKDDFIRVEFLIDYARSLAKLFGRDARLNKPAQIRKFFDFCRNVEGVYKTKKNFLYVKSELPKLVPLVNKASSRELVSSEFVEFVEKNIAQATKSDAHFLKGFMPHFEAVIGYSST